MHETLTALEASTQLNRAQEMSRRGDFDSSIMLLTKIKFPHELRPAGLNLLGQAYQRSDSYKSYDRANALFTEALEDASYPVNLDQQVISLVGLMYSNRTGNEDPNYDPGQNLGKARGYGELVTSLLLSKDLSPSVRMRAHLEFGLLEQSISKNGDVIAAYTATEKFGLNLLDPKKPEKIACALLGSIHETLGGLYENKKNYPTALKYLFKAYADYEEVGNFHKQGEISLAIAHLYRKMSTREPFQPVQAKYLDNAGTWYQMVSEFCYGPCIFDKNVVLPVIPDLSQAAQAGLNLLQQSY